MKKLVFRCQLWLPALACLFVALTAGNGIAQKPDAEKKDPPNIVSAMPTADGIVAKLRPLIPTMSSGDPIRFALHFEDEKGPFDYQKPAGKQMLDRTATAMSLEVAVKIPGGEWKILKPAAPEKKINPQVVMFYSLPTFLLEVNQAGLISHNVDGREELRLPWNWEGAPAPGELKIAVRGKLHLRAAGQGPVDKRPLKKIPFRVGPMSVQVVQADPKKFKTQVDLENAAIKALSQNAEVLREGLKIKGLERLTIGAENETRIVRIRADMKPPEPGKLIIAVGGGQGYWRYELEMKPDGTVASVRRQRAGFCIARGTTIETPNGAVPVEKIRVGQQVWGFDLDSNKRVATEVRAIFKTPAYNTVRIGKLRATGNHPLYTTAGWKAAASLTAKDRLLGFDGKQRNAGVIEIVPGKVDVFDLVVGGGHNYFAGGLLVHNKSIAWTPQHFVPWYALWNRVPVPKKK